MSTISKAKTRAIRFISISLMLVAVSISCVGCFYTASGHLGIHAKIYEWVDAPSGADSEIYIESTNLGKEVAPLLEEMDEELSGRFELIPVEGVEIAVDLKAELERGSDVWSFKAYSDAEGEAIGGGTVPPQSDVYVLRVTKPGYEELVKEIYKDSFNYAIVVLLVKEDA